MTSSWSFILQQTANVCPVIMLKDKVVHKHNMKAYGGNDGMTPLIFNHVWIRTCSYVFVWSAVKRTNVIVSQFMINFYMLTWRIWWAPNNASGWQMGFNSALKGLRGKNSLYTTLHTCQMQWSSRFRHCATNRKVVGSIPDGVIGIFPCHNTSGRTVTLGLTQPLTQKSTRNTS